MRVVVGPCEHAAAGDDSVNDLKLRLGPVYLFAKKRQWVTSRAIMGPANSISRAELQATLANLNAPRTLVQAHYSFEDLLTLNLDGEHEVWVALGQTMPPHVPVNPRFYRATTHVAAPDLHRLLLDYLPLVDDTVYGCALADLPNASVYLTAAEPALRQEGARIVPSRVLVRAVKCTLPSQTNRPVPLARAFQTLHACAQVPVLRLNAVDPLYRVYERVDFETVLPLQDGSLTCVWPRASLVCHFRVGGGVEITYTPSQPAPLNLCNARIKARLNPFIERLNCAIERDDTYPLFHEIDAVVNMKCALEFDAPFPANICARASSNNVAREINRSGTVLRMRQLGLTQPEAEAVLAGEAAQPLHFRAEGARVLVDNVDNLRYFSFLREGSAAAPAPEPVVSGEEQLALVGFKEFAAVVEDPEEVFDFAPRDDGYDVVRLAVGAVGAGDLPSGIRAFLGDSTVYRGPEMGFMAAISRAVGADLRALLEQGDSRWFNAYPHARERFATQRGHPLLRSSPRDNFVRYLRSDPDHTYLWDMVCLPGLFPDGFNLVVFTGECAHTADLVHRRGCAFDPARKTVVLWQRAGRYALLRTPASALFSFSDYEFLIKINKVAPPLKRAPLTCDALVRNLEKSNYEFQGRVEHRGKIVGVVAALAGRACLLPCFPNETRTNLPGLKAGQVPKLGYAETVDFLERAARELRAQCRPKCWVQGMGGACVGLLTESNQFVPCKSTPCPQLPAVTVPELKYGVCDYESTLYLVLRGAFRAEFQDPKADDARRAVSDAANRLVEWVDALPPELLTYPRYVNRKLLVPKQLRDKFVNALADELPLHKAVFLNGVEHAVCENELLY